MWRVGRRPGGYQTLTLWISELFKFDILLIRFLEGSYLDYHVDESPIPNHEHHRINLVIIPAIKGGRFMIGKKLMHPFFNYFRSDIEVHKVTRVEEGNRYVLSIGWLKKC